MKKKRKPTPMGQLNGFLEYASEHAPDLLPVAATLFPFRELIGSFSAGPQNGEDREPYFGIEVSYGDGMMLDAEITADRVQVQDLMLFEGEWMIGDEGTMTLDQLYDFLRQIPRPASSFLTSSIGDD